MSLKILHVGDLHISGTNFERAKVALKQVSEKLLEEKVSVLIFSGDIFDRYNIADRYKTVGELQKVFLSFIQSVQVDKIIINVGNHDTIGDGKSALEFLKGTSSNLFICESPKFFPIAGVGIGMMPWISKGRYSSQCVGKARSESDTAFTGAIHDLLGYWSGQFKKHKEELDVPCLLFGHCDVQGTAASEYYTVQGGSFAFTHSQLTSTGADYVSLSHIHKRQGLYVGALFQTNFGEEGNPQGFEIIEINEKAIREEYVEIDLPTYKTVDIRSIADIPDKDESLLKLRFHDEDAFVYAVENECLTPDSVIEKLWNKRKYVSRTEIPVSIQMSYTELLEQFITINPLPAGLDKKRVLEVAA